MYSKVLPFNARFAVRINVSEWVFYRTFSDGPFNSTEKEKKMKNTSLLSSKRT